MSIVQKLNMAIFGSILCVLSFVVAPAAAVVTAGSDVRTESTSMYADDDFPWD
jgi:hypothetical protein